MNKQQCSNKPSMGFINEQYKNLLEFNESKFEQKSHRDMKNARD